MYSKRQKRLIAEIRDYLSENEDTYHDDMGGESDYPWRPRRGGREGGGEDRRQRAFWVEVSTKSPRQRDTAIDALRRGGFEAKPAGDEWDRKYGDAFKVKIKKSDVPRAASILTQAIGRPDPDISPVDTWEEYLDYQWTVQFGFGDD